MNVELLLVTCCLEPSRFNVLQQVVTNIRHTCPPEWAAEMTVFDNGSTQPGTIDLLRGNFRNVYRVDRNVGYWTAIDWWLERMKQNENRAPDFTYVIESDMIHYDPNGVKAAATFLRKNSDLGAVRLHEYSIQDFRLYDKDRPVPGSRSNLWQSHTNRVTGQAIVHHQAEPPFWRTNFLTQLPALNRFPTMKRVFDRLHAQGRFTELDFQRLYHEEYPEIAILDGGAFNCDLNPYGTDVVTGSWTNPSELQRLGYQNTRFASIVPRDQYIVSRLG